MYTKIVLIGAVLLVIALAAAYFLYDPLRPAPARNTESSSATTSEKMNTPLKTTSVEVALLDTEGKTTGAMQGCDRIVMIDEQIAPTQAPLSAALKKLFSLSSTTVDGWYNFIAKTNSTLSFDHATIENGVASIYLTGSLSGLGGVCDDPRAAAQITQTAMQFSTVNSVRLYLNGSSTTLIPSER